MPDVLLQMKQRHLRGEIGGIVSVCSSHPVVLRTALRMAQEQDVDLLIEATANQVNQFGGYTGLSPGAFMRYIGELTRQAGIAFDRILIGADHLGPHVWKDEPAVTAIEKCEELVRQCIRAGFHKIHLDTAVRCVGDPGPELPLDLTAARAARLCCVAEGAWRDLPDRVPPVYVIGNEVPAPGGALEKGGSPEVTEPGDLMPALDIYAQAFKDAGVSDAWQRVVAVVVQPGADFGDRQVAHYRSKSAARLSAAHGLLPGIMTFEIHATDYQLPSALQSMIADHFMLLKVGPCLTFALRQALYALADIEAALPGIGVLSGLKQVTETLMRQRPGHWDSYYSGSREDLFFLRHYSLRDRLRYYWSLPDARRAVQRLMDNLHRPIPSALLGQYLPDLFENLSSGDRRIDPEMILEYRVRNALTPYLEAVQV
jgi:D-tagatose-1,6-bisphosphate aldolase subunit GatZ/KbaZ